MDKRTILALVLMSLIMLVWIVFIAPKTPKPEKPNAPAGQSSTVTDETPTDTSESTELATTPPTASDTLPPSETQVSAETRLKQLAETPHIRITTPLYEAEIAETTGTITQWKLFHYDKRNGNVGEPIDLIPTVEDDPVIGSRCLDLTSQSIRGLESATWQLQKRSETQLVFSTQQGDLEIVKQYDFSQDQYVADITIRLRNLAAAPRRVDYHLHWGPGIMDDMAKPNKKKAGPVVFFRDAPPKAKPIRDVAGDKSAAGTPQWAGMQSKYFAAILIPDTSLQTEYSRWGIAGKPIPYVATPYYEVVLESREFVLGGEGEPDSSVEHRYRLYAGPKVARWLSTVTAPGAEETPAGLGKLNDLGVFGLANLMLLLLNLLHGVVKNYGIAILLLTTVIKLALYPLTQMGYRSTKKTQQLQPLMTEVRQKYRDDPQRMNKATMRLYKENGINPMGGCLPMLPQMPIFFALYYAVRSAAELRSASFLWIPDLSLPDTIFTVGGIGINPLPLLMGASMLWQQSMAGTGATDASQAKFMKYLPILFTFFFYNMPSGLVLYWFWNNALTIAQQYLINRTYDFGELVSTDTKPNQKRK